MHDRDRKFVISIDLGGHNLRTALVDDKGEIHESSRIRVHTSREVSIVMEQIVEQVRELLDRHQDKNIVSMGLALPGFVNRAKGWIYRLPNFPSWIDISIRELLQDQIDLPIVIENDANAAAMGEYHYGKGHGVDSFVMLTLGTGIGSGIIQNGEIFKGSRGVAGELGHMKLLDDEGPLCGCGQRGCFEALTSGAALQRDSGFKAKELHKQSLEGNTQAQAVFQKMGVTMGRALSNIAFTLDPDVIAIGGRVSQAFDYFAPTMQKTFIEIMGEHPAKATEIVHATHWNEAGMIGMAYTALHAYQD